VGCFLLKKPISAGFLTLATAFGIHFISSLLQFVEWTPPDCLAHANKLTPTLDSTLLIPLGMTVLLIVLMITLTLSRLKRHESGTQGTYRRGIGCSYLNNKPQNEIASKNIATVINEAKKLSYDLFKNHLFWRCRLCSL
jgi:hypothetical protein